MFYLFAATERAINPDDIMLARRTTKKALIAIADRLDGVETYIMDSADVLMWFSWPDIDAAVAASEY